MQVLPVSLQVEDGIADQLPGPVERDVAAPLDLEQVNALRRQGIA